jgi:hypothetical protein
MCKNRGHHHRHHHRKRMSPERFARKVGERVKVLVDEQNRQFDAVRRAGLTPPPRKDFYALQAIAEREIKTGKRDRYDFGQGAEAPRVPAGSNAGRFGHQGGVPAGRGTTGADYLSSNQPVSTSPRAIDAGSESLLKLNGRLQRLQRELDERRMELKRRGPTLAEIREFEEMEAQVNALKADLFRQHLNEVGSAAAEARSKEVSQFAYRNGMSYDAAMAQLYPRA